MSEVPTSGSAKIVAASGQVSCDVNGETLILSTTTNSYYSLQGVGARIWALLATPRTIEEIRDTLLAEYDVDPDTCEADIRKLVDHLSAESLIAKST